MYMYSVLFFYCIDIILPDRIDLLYQTNQQRFELVTCPIVTAN